MQILKNLLTFSRFLHFHEIFGNSIIKWASKLGIEGGLQGWWDEAEDYQLQEHSTCGVHVGHYTQ